MAEEDEGLSELEKVLALPLFGDDAIPWNGDTVERSIVRIRDSCFASFCTRSDLITRSTQVRCKHISTSSKYVRDRSASS